MKQLLTKYVMAAVLLTSLLTACRKNPLQEPASLNENTVAGRGASTCAICDAQAKANDLSSKLQTYNFREGTNVVSSLADGTKIVAQVKSGQISQWVLETKTGKQFLPESTERLTQQINRFGRLFHIYRICFYLDGLYNCWLVIKI